MNIVFAKIITQAKDGKFFLSTSHFLYQGKVEPLKLVEGEILSKSHVNIMTGKWCYFLL